MSARCTSHRLALALAFSVAACQTSPAPIAVPQATSAFGAHATLALSGGRSAGGELLEVTDSSVTLLVDGRLAVARVGAIATMRVDGMMDDDILHPRGVLPSPKVLARARGYARYPYGITPAMLATLLAKQSQASVDTLARAGQP